MTDPIDKIIDGIIQREGGFVDLPDDRGGPTYLGVNAAELGHWRKLGRPATHDEVFALGESEARAIYRSDYIEKPGFKIITDPELLDLVVDSAVNHGPVQAIRFIQEALGLLRDGVFGPISRAAVLAGVPRKIRHGVFSARLKFYGRLITSSPRQAAFASGWLNRLATFVETY